MDLKINGAIKAAEEVVKSLNEATEDVTLVINSPGGSVLEGLQVVNAIRNCKQKVTAKVEVMACSMGGVIALACNQLIMHKDDLLMLHNCMSYAEGNKEEMANVIESMKAIDAVLHSIVMEHAKDKTLDARIDNGEVWLTGEQAAEMFDHVIIEDAAKRPDMVAVAGFAGVIHKLQDLEAEKRKPNAKQIIKFPKIFEHCLTLLISWSNGHVR